MIDGLRGKSAVLLAALAVGTSADPVDLVGQDVGAPSALRDAVEAAEISFAATMAERDFEAFLAHISAEAVFFAGERPLRGREAVAEGWRGFFEGPNAPFAWRPDLVEVLPSGDLALSTGPVMNGAGEVIGRFNSIWRLDADGRWRVVFDKGCP